MKKFRNIIAIVISALMILSFTGCASAPQNQSDTVKVTKIEEKGIAKLAKDLLDDKLIESEAIDVQNEVIGAIAGYRFIAKISDSESAIVEIYEYDKDNLNDTAKGVISEVKKNGSFNMLEMTDVEAELSDNEKYLMIYQDDKSKGDNADQAHKERRNKITEIFEKAK